MKRLATMVLLLGLAGCGPRVGQEYTIPRICEGVESKAAFLDRAHCSSLTAPGIDALLAPGNMWAEQGQRVRVVDTCPDGVRLEFLGGSDNGKMMWTKTDYLTIKPL